MQAMILAAGFGKRLRPFTQRLPKPLLELNGLSLIERLLLQLQQAGVVQVMINLAHLGGMIEAKLGNGDRFGLRIDYSYEPEDAPLETGGAVQAVLPWFANKPFVLLSADIWTDYPWAELMATSINRDCPAHLVLVPRPAWQAHYDFALSNSGYVEPYTAGVGYTYANFGVYHPCLWDTFAPGVFAMSEVFRHALQQQSVLKGSVYRGPWFNIGSQERLSELCAHMGIRLQDTNLIV